MLKKIEKLLKSIKTQSALPSISMPKPKMASAKSTSKIPGIAQSTKKNPIKVAEQTSNLDIKDIKMKEAQEHFKISKSTGQWSMD